MSSRASLIRKVVYLAIMAALLLPLSVISQPAATGAGGGRGAPGGVLARMREAQGLSPANLGKIDPAGEAMRLSLLGMRGVAANLMWSKAENYKRKKDWTNLSQTLNQLIYLEPHFIKVWQNQGWNLAYNISVEWDDYRDRYSYIKKGIAFLDEGTIYNGREPRLVTDIGRFTSQKIGRSDERQHFRRMFRVDREFHNQMGYRSTDNWLAGREKFVEAEELVQRQGLTIQGASPLVFYVEAPMCRINYAVALETDGGPDGRGVYGEVAVKAWDAAAAEWDRYGARDIIATTGEVIRLGELELQTERLQKAMGDIEALSPGLKDKIVTEKRAALSPEERAIIDGPTPHFGSEAQKQYQAIQGRLSWNLAEVANRVEEPNRAKALELAELATQTGKIIDRISGYHGIVNFPYWKGRCEYERDPETVKARELITLANTANYQEANMLLARDLYEQGMAKWRLVIDKYKLLEFDPHHLEYLVGMTDNYHELLNQLGEKFPDDFILQDVRDAAAKDPNLSRQR